MKRMAGEMPKSARFGDTKNSDSGERDTRERQLENGLQLSPATLVSASHQCSVAEAHLFT